MYAYTLYIFYDIFYYNIIIIIYIYNKPDQINSIHNSVIKDKALNNILSNQKYIIPHLQ